MLYSCVLLPARGCNGLALTAMLTNEQLAERFVKQIRPLVSPSIPLYEPHPRDDDNQFRIGDVGIIVQGAFYRKFNVIDKRHPVNMYDEDLGEYQPIPFDPDTDVNTKTIAPAGGTMWCSKGLSWKKVDADPGFVWRCMFAQRANSSQLYPLRVS